jgi:hypothetical protein
LVPGLKTYLERKNTMPKLTLNISEQQLEFVQNQSEAEGFAEPSAYIEKLVADEELRLQKYYYEKCLEAVNDPRPPVHIKTEEERTAFWNDIREQSAILVAERKQRREAMI